MSLLKFINPKTYICFAKAQLEKTIANTSRDLRAGSINPIFKGMLLVGGIGYVMEYTLAGSKLLLFVDCVHSLSSCQLVV